MCLDFGWLAACSDANDPYAKIEGAPLVPATLHTVTLVADAPARRAAAGVAAMRLCTFAPNYQAAIHVESALWDVPEDAAGKVALLKGPAGGARPARARDAAPTATPPADAGVSESFYRNVLGTDVPQWPQNVARADNVRVQVWTYFIADVLDANRKLRAHTIPVTDRTGRIHHLLPGRSEVHGAPRAGWRHRRAGAGLGAVARAASAAAPCRDS